MPPTIKPWGTLEILPSVTENGETHVLRIRAGEACSRHYHDDKRNLFHVISGRLIVVQWLGKVQNRSVLDVGETVVVESGIDHQFITDDKPAVVLEQYWVTDIHRRVVY